MLFITVKQVNHSKHCVVLFNDKLLTTKTMFNSSVYMTDNKESNAIYQPKKYLTILTVIYTVTYQLWCGTKLAVYMTLCRCLLYWSAGGSGVERMTSAVLKSPWAQTIFFSCAVSVNNFVSLLLYCLSQ